MTDPWKDLGCERNDCFPCKSNNRGKCYNQSITYQIDCITCQNKGKKVSYIGESGRTGFDRGLDHIKAISKGDTSNACAKHQVESHQGMPWNFSMKVLKTSKYPLERQTYEGRLVEDFQGDEILNQKGEWGCNLPPTLTTERNLE